MNQRALTRLGLGAAALFAALNVGFVGLSQDTYTVLYYAVRFLREGGLYTQWLIVSLPFVVLPYAPVAALVPWLHLPPGFLLHLYVTGLCAGSIFATHLALGGRAPDDTRRFWLMASAVTLLVISSLCSVFADREHLLFIFALPWMLQVLLGLRPLAFTAFLAVFGFFLKPHNLIFFAALQLLGGQEGQPWHKRIFTPSLAVITGLGILYMAIVGLFFPGYFQNVASLAVIAYPYLYKPLAEKLTLGCALTGVAMMLVFECMPSRRERLAWYGFLSAGVAVYCLNAGWGYTLYLMFAPITLLCFSLLRRSCEGEGHRFSALATRRIAQGLLLLLLMQSGWFLAQDVRSTAQDGYARNYIHLSPAFYARLRAAAGSRFILLSTTLWSMNLSGLGTPPESAFAYDFLWPLPWAYAHPDSPHYAFARDALDRSLLDALTAYPEATLMVDTSPTQWKLPDNMDLLEWFKADDRIRAALSSYVQAGTIDNCAEPRDRELKDAVCRFTLWRAQPRPEPFSGMP